MYYNQFTKKYHLNKRTAESILETIEGANHTLEKLNSSSLKEKTDCYYNSMPVDFYLRDLKTIIINCKENKDYISFDESVFLDLKEKLGLLTDILIKIWNKDEINLGKKSENEINELRRLAMPVFSILSMLNTNLNLGVYPSYYNDFLK